MSATEKNTPALPTLESTGALRDMIRRAFEFGYERGQQETTYMPATAAAVFIKHLPPAWKRCINRVHRSERNERALLGALKAADAALRHHPAGDNRATEDIAAAHAAIAMAEGRES